MISLIGRIIQILFALYKLKYAYESICKTETGIEIKFMVTKWGKGGREGQTGSM